MQTPTLADTLLAALAPLPDNALIPVGHVRRLLNGDGAPASAGDLLDVEGIATMLDRSLSTARALCASGSIPNSFRLNNREWRCRRSDVEGYLDAERERHVARTNDSTSPRSRRPRSLGSWREIASGDE